MAFELHFAGYPNADSGLRYALVPWDSESFGFPVHELRGVESADATAEIDALLAELDVAGGGLICAKVDQREVPTLHSLGLHGFYPVETVLEAEGALPAQTVSSREQQIPVSLRRAVAEDMEDIKRIASAAFWSDRFHLDPNLPNGPADARYVSWVERAFAEDESLYAYERTDSRAVIGFYHVRPVSPETVDLTLAAVDPSLGGLGLGSALYRLAVSECADLGFSRAQTRIVARNLPVLNIFAQLGFSFRAAHTSMHRFTQPVIPAGDAQ